MDTSLGGILEGSESRLSDTVDEGSSSLFAATDFNPLLDMSSAESRSKTGRLI